MDEGELVDEIQKGNASAFKFIFENYYRLLCLYAESFLKQSDLAEDAVQAVMVAIWEKRQRLTIRSSLKNYLYAAVKNACLNEYKRSRIADDFLSRYRDEALSRAIKVEEDLVQKRILMLNREIEALPKKTKEIFILNKKRGLTYQEIAQIKNLSERTVESHLSRAMDRIRNNLSKLNLQIFL